MDREAAEEFSQSVDQVVTGAYRLVLNAERMGVPKTLGLSTRAWADKYIGNAARVSLSERPQAARQLTAPKEESGEGLSQRKAAEILGVSKDTIARDLGLRGAFAPPENEEPQVEASSLPESGAFAPPEDGQESSESRVHVANNSGDDEWYTPPEYIKAAVAVMGAIDLDPASSDVANEVVGAANYYTAADDGLSHPWSGRVWMNPPYVKTLIEKFCIRLAQSYASGEVSQAVVLVNNATDTTWFQALASSATAMCFPKGRIRFWHQDRTSKTPLQGQAVIYMGDNVANFRKQFLPFGFVVTVR